MTAFIGFIIGCFVGSGITVFAFALFKAAEENMEE